MPEIAEQIVDLSQLLAKSIEGKTPSTVKYYRACISSFRKFLGNDTIDVTDFDENDLSRFAAWLVDEKVGINDKALSDDAARHLQQFD